MEENINSIVNSGISNNFDFWNDANDFLKTIVNNNAEELITQHIKLRKFNDNEIRLFREYLVKAFDKYPMMAYIKNFK